MKRVFMLVLCAALGGAAHAEMIDLDHSEDGLTTLRGLAGSMKATPKGATAVFSSKAYPYKGAESAKVTNFRVTVAKTTCQAGAGPLRFSTLTGELFGNVEWAEGDGSLADSMAVLLCDTAGVKR